MRFFKNESNVVYAYEDDQVEDGHADDKTEITEAERDVLLAPSPEEAKEIQRRVLKAARDADLNAMTYTFLDGKSMQNRPIDAANIETAISLGVSRDWLMSDNTKRLTTVVEMQDALTAGVLEAASIWQTYIDAVDAL